MPDAFAEAVNSLEKRIAALSAAAARFRPDDRKSLRTLIDASRSLAIGSDDMIAEALDKCGLGRVWDENDGEHAPIFAALETEYRAAVRAEVEARYAIPQSLAAE